MEAVDDTEGPVFAGGGIDGETVPSGGGGATEMRERVEVGPVDGRGGGTEPLAPRPARPEASSAMPLQ